MFRNIPERLHDPFRKLRADPFDQAGTEIFLNTENSRGQGLLEGFNGKLTAVLGGHLPHSCESQNSSDVHLRHGPHHGDQVIITFGLALDCIFCDLLSTPHTFTSGFFSPNFSLSISQISPRTLPCFSMLLMVL